ncbi:MAG TPA: response regulator [Candidatus Acidoferrales bacterium]
MGKKKSAARPPLKYSRPSGGNGAHLAGGNSNSRDQVLLALLEDLDTGVANLSREGLILYANRRFAGILGVRGFATATGSSIQRYISAASWDSLNSALAAAVEAPIHGEMRINASGETRVVRLSLGPIFAKDGTTTIRAVASEVTELVKTSQELRDSKASLYSLSARLLQSQDEERRRIARDLHDITGQELAVLGMSLELAARNLESPKKAREALTESVALAHKIEDEIRTLSYLLHPPLLDELGLGSALSWYAEGFQKRTKIRVDTQIAPNLPRLSPGDETTFFRVVQESLANVLRHSGSPTARISLSMDAGVARLSVEDQGKGISREILTPGRDTTGLGVGIAGMRERLLQIGGTLEINSTGSGTTVVATLPLAKQEGHSEPGQASRHLDEAQARPAALPIPVRKRILIADDHEVTRHGVVSLLAGELDIEVCGEAQDGLEVVAKAKELKPDLVLLDLTMPRAGGLTAAYEIRKMDAPPKILIFTNHSYHTLEENIRSAHCDGYVLKSNASRDLIRGIRAVLDGDKFYNPEAARAQTA